MKFDFKWLTAMKEKHERKAAQKFFGSDRMVSLIQRIENKHRAKLTR
jgi:hypothetical protein